MNIKTNLEADSYLVTHEVGPNQNGIRLDAFLKSRYRRRSREAIKRAIDSGAITIERNQGPHVTVGKLKPSSQLIPGDEVLVLSERKPEPEVNFDYKILFEDEHLFIIDKPANLPVHPAGRYFFNTLLVHLRTEGHTNPLRSGREYFLVHRIDKETSGVLVLAKNREACAHIVKQFAARETKKRYYAVVHGSTPPEFTVQKSMRRTTIASSKISLKMEIAPVEDGGMTARTDFKTLYTTEKNPSTGDNPYARGNFSLVECFPKTGRQHQIRVHLDTVGHPIVGDKLYGRPESEALQFYERQYLTPETEAKLILPRHALHSAGICFIHPMTGENLEFRSQLPKDLSAFIGYATSEPAKLPTEA